ncbi:hypothetical protein EON64_16405 [archaeon]|nr:MAG: hypothetical protein EON64_16405 [archaeon]
MQVLQNNPPLEGELSSLNKFRSKGSPTSIAEKSRRRKRPITSTEPSCSANEGMQQLFVACLQETSTESQDQQVGQIRTHRCICLCLYVCCVFCVGGGRVQVYSGHVCAVRRSVLQRIQ